MLADWQRRFRCPRSTRYQDTSVCQYLWLRLLGPGRRRTSAVGGDDPVDLRLARRRGRHPALRRDFPGALVIGWAQLSLDDIFSRARLPHILAGGAGSAKTLFTDDARSPDAEEDPGHNAWSSEEARSIGDEIGSLQRKGAPPHRLRSPSWCAPHFQMREFRDRFVTLGYPIRLVGGPLLRRRRNPRPAIPRVTAQPADDLAFERIVQHAKRGSATPPCNRSVPSTARVQACPAFEAARHRPGPTG